MAAPSDLLARCLSPAFLRSIRRLDLRARTLVDGLLAGRHAATRHGFSVEFSDYREYVPGDDLQHVDWRVYVRTDQYYVKRYRAETHLRCTIVLDATASMDYASGAAAMTKYEYARTMASALAILLTRQNDRVGLMIARNGLAEHVPARSRRIHLYRLLERLQHARPEGTGNCGAALEQAAGLLKRRGLVIVLSDFLPAFDAGGEPEEERGRLRRALGHLVFRGHDVVLFHVLDPAERDAPFDAPRLLVDPESAREIPFEPPSSRAAFAEASAAWRAQLARDAAKQRAEYIETVTDTPFDRALERFVGRRRRSGR